VTVATSRERREAAKELLPAKGGSPRAGGGRGTVEGRGETSALEREREEDEVVRGGRGLCWLKGAVRENWVLSMPGEVLPDDEVCEP
jgi:hypothetical protein